MKMTRIQFFFVFFSHLALLFEKSRALEDKCPRPDEISPCQCRTRGPTIQIRCTNSMIERITEAMLSIRRRIDSVDVLILENNNIPHLPSRAFGSVPVNRLFIENNRIGTIDRNAFAGVENHLTEIYIKEPNLHILPRDSINFLKKLTVFSVENSKIMDFPYLEGLKELKLFRVDGSRIRNIPSNTFKNLPSLRYLHVSNSRLVRLDIGVLESLNYLVLANFTNNEISWIHPRAFRYMEQMHEVSLKGNHLKDASMVGRACRVIKTLKKLDVSHNRIRELRKASFMDIISLEQLDLSHNRLEQLKQTAIYRLPRLKVVDLSHNSITSFHSDAFKDTPMVEELILNKNALSHVSDVSFLMDSLPKLTILDLSDNEIRGIPFGALRGYPKLEKLSMANNQISQLSRDALSDMPSLTHLDLSHNKLIADALDGPIFDLSRLQHLRLSHNKLSKLSNDLLSNLHQLTHLDVSHNGILTLEENALRHMRRLEALNISFNNLRELSTNAFVGLTELRQVDASHNELIALSDNLLADQSRLEHLNFAFNQIQLLSSQLLPERNSIQYLDLTSNFILNFPNELLRRLDKLKKLLLRKNSIQKLRRGSFQGLSRLETLDMHDNRVEVIETDAFEDLLALKNLDLSLNIISTVGDNLEPLENLMKLNLSDNYITSLPRKAFHSLRRLATLDISNNTIMDIGRAFVDMPELKYLDLSYNHLPIVKKGSFQALPNLIALHLHHNSIVELQSGAFEDLESLERIELTKNGIPDIQRNTFKDLGSLTVLKLDDNLIKSLDIRSFIDLFSLHELHLQQNLLERIEENAFVRIPSIRFLNLSYNLVQELPRSGFSSLETLETIDLSFNDLREVDERAFQDLKWLNDLRLNDNNICRIEKFAFETVSSLRSLKLHNNRLTKIDQNSFGKIQQQLSKVNIAGNPLTCDCNTLWLRNWASDSNAIGDDPRCYFPKSLSGNKLRKLRSSRFTCEGRSANLLRDACTGVPLKKPVQSLVKVAPATEEYPYPVTESESVEELQELQTTLSNEKIDEQVTTTTDPIDDDAVIVDDSTDKTGENEDYYEYYYVYYDEKGQVIENAPAQTKPQKQPQHAQETKVQEIVLNKPQSSTTSGDPDKITGDTPTIYAEIQNPQKQEEDEKSEEEGLSIFGIPIPKIPISLSFGLGPALSQGLLPIGRKGDLDGSGADIPAVVDRGQDRHSMSQTELLKEQEKDQTRGPDILDPIWVETGLKAASQFLLPHLKSSLGFGDSEKEKSKEAVGKRETPMQSASQQIYNYHQPSNPIIPISNLGSTDMSNFPSKQMSVSNQRRGSYYPKNFIPAIKFDHPIPGRPGPLSGITPVFPPPSAHKQNHQPVIRPKRKHQSYSRPVGQLPRTSLKLGSPQDHVNGFRPLFRPDKVDPYSRGDNYFKASQNSAFPGIDSTLAQAKLPPGFKTPAVFSTEPNLYPPIKVAPSLTFTSPATNEIPASSTEGSSVLDSTSSIPSVSSSTIVSSTIGPTYDAVPGEAFSGREEQGALPEPDQAAFSSTSTLSSLNDVISERASQEDDEQLETTNSKGEDQEYEYVYEYYEDEDSLEESGNQQPLEAFNEEEVKNKVNAILNRLKETSTTTDASSEQRTVPTLAVEEVTTVRDKSTTIQISHKGTPAELTETTTAVNSVTDDLEEGTEQPEYEYEYYYEYEDEDGDPIGAGEEEEERISSTSTDSSLQNLLSIMQKDKNDALLPNAHISEPNRLNRPTYAPVIRSTTLKFDTNNFLESQRSSVTVDTISANRIGDNRASNPNFFSIQEDLKRPRSSSPYPFHPDHLDPRRRPNPGNDVDWYYNNYNSQNNEPFIGPGVREQENGANTSHIYHPMTLICSLVAVVMLM